MDAEVWRVLVPLLLAAGSGVTWWVARRDRNKDPLPKQQAELVIAEQALGIVTNSALRLETDVLRERQERTADREQYKAERDHDRRRITQLERDRSEDRVKLSEADGRITRLENLLAQAASYIEALLRWAQIVPNIPGKPIPPLPKQLHELVDPQLWVTRADPKE